MNEIRPELADDFLALRSFAAARPAKNEHHIRLFAETLYEIVFWVLLFQGLEFNIVIIIDIITFYFFLHVLLFTIFAANILLL